MKQLVKNLCLLMVLPLLTLVSCGSSEKKSQTTDTAKLEETVANDSVACQPTVIDFYATWCGPCRQISPLFDQLKEKYGDKITFRSIDVDENTALAEQYGISSIPAFIFLDAQGKEVKRIVGADADALVKEVKDIYGAQP